MKKKISRKERLEHIKKCGINLDEDGRIRIDNSVMSKLKPKVSRQTQIRLLVTVLQKSKLGILIKLL